MLVHAFVIIYVLKLIMKLTNYPTRPKTPVPTPTISNSREQELKTLLSEYKVGSLPQDSRTKSSLSMYIKTCTNNFQVTEPRAHNSCYQNTKQAHCLTHDSRTKSSPSSTSILHGWVCYGEPFHLIFFERAVHLNLERVYAHVFIGVNEHMYWNVCDYDVIRRKSTSIWTNKATKTY
jgi:hypothetical protein